MGAFDTLIQRYQDQVYSVAYRLVGNEDDAADVAQEVFLAFFRYIGSYRGDSKLSTWLYRITVNMAKNLWSRQKRQGYEVTESLDDPRDDDPDSPAPVEMLADPAPNPRHRAAGSEIVGVIERKLQEIEPEFREAIVLRFIEGLSYEEIAEVTKEPLGTVKSRIFRARKALKDRMKDYLKEI
jgi:RNA polymerase sigma-70 factor (ECF subfamily)